MTFVWPLALGWARAIFIPEEASLRAAERLGAFEPEPRPQ